LLKALLNQIMTNYQLQKGWFDKTHGADALAAQGISEGLLNAFSNRPASPDNRSEQPPRIA
jgi:hypothetical protein